MDKQKIITLLKDYNPQDVQKFASYIIDLFTERDKTSGKPKNYWLHNRKEEEMAELFKRVNKEGLIFDGKHITLQSTGISYDYVAYKNKMLLAYPESMIDIALVYQGDEFAFKKESGQVKYSHNIKNPFQQKDSEIIGGYCVIKNKRGEFLTVMSPEDIQKHRKVAKTDYIWKQWFKEMCLKTVIKKSVKNHFDDIYQNIEEMDNENYDLDNPVDLPIDHKSKIDSIENMEELKKYWEDNKGIGKEFDQYVMTRKQQLIKLPVNANS